MLLVCVASSAEASPITIAAADVGDTFSFNEAVTAQSGTTVSVSFSALISSYSFNAALNRTELALNVTITNTTSLAFDSSLRGYGFNSTPDVTGGLSTSTVFDTVTPG